MFLANVCSEKLAGQLKFVKCIFIDDRSISPWLFMRRAWSFWLLNWCIIRVNYVSSKVDELDSEYRLPRISFVSTNYINSSDQYSRSHHQCFQQNAKTQILNLVLQCFMLTNGQTTCFHLHTYVLWVMTGWLSTCWSRRFSLIISYICI